MPLGGNAMPSAHYQTICACVEENITLMSDASGKVKPENRILWNIGNALLAFSDALQDEFVYLNTRITSLEERLNR